MAANVTRVVVASISDFFVWLGNFRHEQHQSKTLKKIIKNAQLIMVTQAGTYVMKWSQNIFTQSFI